MRNVNNNSSFPKLAVLALVGFALAGCGKVEKAKQDSARQSASVVSGNGLTVGRCAPMSGFTGNGYDYAQGLDGFQVCSTSSASTLLFRYNGWSPRQVCAIGVTGYSLSSVEKCFTPAAGNGTYLEFSGVKMDGAIIVPDGTTGAYRAAAESGNEAYYVYGRP